MYSYNKETVERLMIAKITGTVTEDENQLFELLLAEDAGFGNDWRLFREQMTILQENGFNMAGDADKSWNMIRSRMKQPQR
jgi:hypothetical protein